MGDTPPGDRLRRAGRVRQGGNPIPEVTVVDTPLEFALDALNQVRQEIYAQGAGSENLRKVAQDRQGGRLDFDTEAKKAQAKTVIFKLRPKSPKVTGKRTMPDIIEYGKLVLNARAGNCGEYSAAACVRLQEQRCRHRYDVVQLPTLDHAFVVIGQEAPGDGLYPADFRTWNPTAAVCDGWANVCCLARDYPAQWDLRMNTWSSEGIEVPEGGPGQWTSAADYRGGVVTDRKESFTYGAVASVTAVEDEPEGRCSCCYITTATCRTLGLPDDCPELRTLRWFRDRVLVGAPDGLRDVAEYYAVAPRIVEAVDRRADADRVYRAVYSGYIRPAVAAVRAGDYPAAHAVFRTMVDRMRDEFLPGSVGG